MKRFDRAQDCTFSQRTSDGQIVELPGFELTGPGGALLRVVRAPETGMVFIISNAPVAIFGDWVGRAGWFGRFWIGLKLRLARVLRRKPWGIAIGG